jgi:hypothetical protein
MTKEINNKMTRTRLTVVLNVEKIDSPVLPDILEKWWENVGSKLYHSCFQCTISYARYFFILFPYCDILLMQSFFCSFIFRIQKNLKNLKCPSVLDSPIVVVVVVVAVATAVATAVV